MADDAAIDDMETADLLCVIYVTGIKNDELREKLLEATSARHVTRPLPTTQLVRNPQMT